MFLSLGTQRLIAGMLWLAALLMVAIALLGGCASADRGLIASGESLRQVGVQFVSVTQFFVDGCQAGTIKPLDCATYSDFGRDFRAQYPTAIAAWETARASNDLAAQGKARDVILKLSEDLSAFTVKALQ